MSVERLRADAKHLERLAAASRGQLRVTGNASPGRRTVSLEFSLPTAADPGYPANAQRTTRVAIDLPARYPFEPPVVRLDGCRVFHPNVFVSGVVCIGSHWQASEGLDLFVTRVVRLLCFDPLLVNLRSVANPAAARWYVQALRRHPEAFPSARVDWQIEQTPAPAHASPLKVVRGCPACGARLRLPAGRSGEVECPRCRHAFETHT